MVDSPDMRLGPPERAARLAEAPESRYLFVITPAPGQLTPDLPADATEVELLPLIGAMAARLRVADALAMATRRDIAQVWYLNPGLEGPVIRLIRALDYLCRTAPMPVTANMSIGVPTDFWTDPVHPDAPDQRAIQTAAEVGVVMVVAVGNYGDMLPVNPWSRAPCVIAVGAWDGAAGRLWPKSSVGVADDPMTWPDIVTQGVDVIGAWPTGWPKSEAGEARDQRTMAEAGIIDPDRQVLLTAETGSSMAAANASRAVGDILELIKARLAGRPVQPQMPLFGVEMPPDWLGRAFDDDGPPPTAPLTQDQRRVAFLQFPQWWLMVKQVLHTFAVPQPGLGPHQQGRGLFDPAMIAPLLAEVPTGPRKIMAIKME